MSEPSTAPHHRSRANLSLAIGAIVLLLLTLYFGAYCGMVRAVTRVEETDEGRVMFLGVEAEYPNPAGIDCSLLFTPIHAIDRRLRPGVWKTKL